MINHDYKLGIVRYAENYDMYFKTMLEEKGFTYELITEFTYKIIMSKDSPLAKLDSISSNDLREYIEIAHADLYVPSMPVSKVVKEELSDEIDRRIFVFERTSQFELLTRNTDTFMWVSPIPQSLLDRYNLVQKDCTENRKIYKDLLIYKNGYKLSKLDRQFITCLTEAKESICNEISDFRALRRSGFFFIYAIRYGCYR